MRVRFLVATLKALSKLNVLHPKKENGRAKIIQTEWWITENNAFSNNEWRFPCIELFYAVLLQIRIKCSSRLMVKIIFIRFLNLHLVSRTASCSEINDTQCFYKFIFHIAVVKANYKFLKCCPIFLQLGSANV